MELVADDLHRSHKEFLSLDIDYERSALAAELYVRDQTPGILRIRKGNGFLYTYRGLAVRIARKMGTSWPQPRKNNAYENPQKP